MKEKIVDIMREKYGVVIKPNGKKLTITDKDTIFSAYRKVAMYLFANHEMTQADELFTVEKEVERRVRNRDQRFLKLNPIQIDYDSASEEMQAITFFVNRAVKSTKGKSANTDWKDHVYYAKGTLESKYTGLYVFVSPSGAFKTSDIDYPFSISRGSHLVLLVNLPLAYGYNKLGEDFTTNFLIHSTSSVIHTQECDSFYYDLFDATMTKLKFAKAHPRLTSAIERAKYQRPVDLSECDNVDKDNYNDDVMARVPMGSLKLSVNHKKGTYEPEEMGYFNTTYNVSVLSDVTLPNEKEKHYIYKNALPLLVDRERVYKLFTRYLQKTQSIFLQVDHDLETEQDLTHARFFEEKKNIKVETQREMNRLGNTLSDHFKHVEIDNDIDLNKLSHITPELKDTVALLPKADDGDKAILRFRKLRNHKVYGIFTTANNTVAVDFRSDENGKIEKAKGMMVGLQSLIHEYGHYLDHNMKSDAISLSSDYRFEDILFNVQSWFDKNWGNKAKNMPLKQSYLTLPSEVFARAFEVYVSRCGLDNSFTADKERINDTSILNVRYACFEGVTLQLIDNYFDNEFPDLKANIQKYVNSSKGSKNIIDKREETVKKTAKKAVKVVVFKQAEQLSLF